MEIAKAMELHACDREHIGSKFVGLGEKIAYLNHTVQSINESAEDIINIFHTNRKIIEQLIVNNEKNEAEVLNISSITSQLENSSKNIGTFTGAIEEIANQINLLSLNASIEAAKAGEHKESEFT